MRLYLPDPATTEVLARLLAECVRAPAVVHLHGDLGAGKSTLARAWLRALGVIGTIRSPTYTLVERYPLVDGQEALHLDLYRIGGGGELEYLALDDAADALWLVEWPERGGAALPAADLQLDLSIEGSGRRAELTGLSPHGQSWLVQLAQNPGLQDFTDA